MRGLVTPEPSLGTGPVRRIGVPATCRWQRAHLVHRDALHCDTCPNAKGLTAIKGFADNFIPQRGLFPFEDRSCGRLL